MKSLLVILAAIAATSTSYAGATGALVKAASRGAQFGVKIPSEERLLKIITSRESLVQVQNNDFVKINIKLGEIRDDHQIITYGIGTNFLPRKPQLFIVGARTLDRNLQTDSMIFESILKANGLAGASGNYGWFNKTTAVDLDFLRARGITDRQLAAKLHQTITNLEDAFMSKNKSIRSRKSIR